MSFISNCADTVNVRKPVPIQKGTKNFMYEEISIKEELMDEEYYNATDAGAISSYPSSDGVNTLNSDYHQALQTLQQHQMQYATSSHLQHNESLESTVFNAYTNPFSEPVERIACDFCGIKYKNRQNLLKHLDKTDCRRQGPVRQIQCGTCGISFSSRINLSRHQKRTGCVQNDNINHEATGETALEKFPALTAEALAKRVTNRMYCDTCGLSYKSRSNLIRHQKTSGCQQRKPHSITLADESLATCTANDRVRHTLHTAANKNTSPLTNTTSVSNSEVIEKTEKISNESGKTLPEAVASSTKEVESESTAQNDSVNMAESMRMEVICDICNRTFENIKRLYNHADSHDRVPSILQFDMDFLKCRYCLKQFLDHNERKKHETTHTGNKPYECFHCQQKFVRSRNLMQHIRIHTGEKPFQCESCSQVFKDKRYLTRHIERHHLQVERLACDLCDVKVYDRVQLALHRRKHAEGYTFACTNCGRTKKVSNEITYQQIENPESDASDEPTGEHTKETKNHLHCNLCDRYFKEKESFFGHADTHDEILESLKNDVEYLKCKYCYREFSTHVERRNHERTHKRKRPYECPHCNKRFISDLSRKIHLRDHSEEPILKCDECLKVFKDKSGLKRHIKRKHLKIRRITCEVCCKKFFDGVELALHMLLHIRSNDYVCEDCKY